MKYLFLLSVSLFGQSTDQNFSPPDCALNSSGAPTVALPCSAPYADSTMPLPTLRYGYAAAPLTYTLTFPTGPALVTLSFVEPNKTGIGQRIFTYKVNNQAPISLDIFKLSGGQKKQLDVTVMTVSSGTITIVLTPQVGNAVISAIRIDQIMTSLLPITQFTTCPNDPTCSAPGFVTLKRADGTTVRIFTTPITLVPTTP